MDNDTENIIDDDAVEEVVEDKVDDVVEDTVEEESVTDDSEGEDNAEEPKDEPEAMTIESIVSAIATLTASVDTMISKLNEGFSSVGAMAIENGGVVKEHNEPVVDTIDSDYETLEDLDYTL